MKNSKLAEYMNESLPTVSFQKRKGYKTTITEIRKIYKLINSEIFNNKLPTAKLVLKNRINDAWGMCIGNKYPTKKKSGCTLIIGRNWYCKQWLIMTIAHEMSHQYQWDVIGYNRLQKNKEPLMSHGPTFYKFRNKMNRVGIPLKRVIHGSNWFKKQNLLKC